MSYNDSIADAELDDFVSKAEKIHAAVSGLARGDLQPEDTTPLLKSLDAPSAIKLDPALEALRAERKQQEEITKKRKGVKGQGARPGYLYFCKHCFLEYDLEPLPADKKDGQNSTPAPVAPASAGQTNAASSTPTPAPKLKCYNCSQSLMSREDRMAELHDKVAVLSARKIERAKRRQQFAQWKTAKESQSKVVVVSGDSDAPVQSGIDSNSLSSKYTDWDMWEPSSDEEAEVPQPDHPEFAAMKADIEARDKKKKAAREVSDRLNEKGNQAVKSKDYLAAVDFYSQAIEGTRGEKSFYTNRALAYIHTFQYELAIKDCDTVNNIFECFEESHTRYTSDYKNMKVVMKGRLRHANAALHLNRLAEARTQLNGATKLIQNLYKNRKEAADKLNEKNDLNEVARLLKQIEEKEAFAKEEQGVNAKNNSTRSQQESKENKEDGDARPEKSTSPVSKSVSSLLPPPSAADSSILDGFLQSVQRAHQALVNASVAAPIDASAAAPASFDPLSQLQRTLELLTLVLASEGNKDRVIAHKESRAVVELILKLASLRPSIAKHAAGGSKSSVISHRYPAQVTEVDVVKVLPLFETKNISAPSNCVSFREKDAFLLLSKYLHQLTSPFIASSQVVLSWESWRYVIRSLTMLTDRENGRELFTSPANSGLLTTFIVELLEEYGNSTSQTDKLTAVEKIHMEDAVLNAANLVANLAYQAKYRTWLCANEQSAQFVRLIAALVAPINSCSFTSEQGKSGHAVLSSCLSVIINLFIQPACRQKFIEPAPASTSASSSSSSASAATPLTLLVQALTHLASRWSKEKFELSANSALSEVSEKVLSCLMNLSVDDLAATILFNKLRSAPSSSSAAASSPSSSPSSSCMAALLQLASKPAATSDATSKASSTSIVSKLSPVLVERALGLLTRGLRREHQTKQVATQPTYAQGAKPGDKPVQTGLTSPSPMHLREMMLSNNGVESVLRILALHEFASEDETLSADSVLAKLNQSTENQATDTTASASATAAPSAFRYTRATVDHASVCLAVCMSSDVSVARSLISFTFQGRNGLDVLVSLLRAKSRNVQGNACLCLDAMCSIPEVLQRKELSDALDVLLNILKDPLNKAAHNNAAKAAILIGRAPHNVEKWTQMRGVEIIASVLKPSLGSKK